MAITGFISAVRRKFRGDQRSPHLVAVPVKNIDSIPVDLGKVTFFKHNKLPRYG